MLKLHADEKKVLVQIELSVKEKRTLRRSQDLNLDLLNAMQSEALSKWSSGTKAEDRWCWTV